MHRRGERRLARFDDERRRRSLAQPEAWARHPLHGTPGNPAGDVDAGVDRAERSRLEREEVVERGDAVRLSGRDREATAHVVETAAADPSDSVLQRVERGQQEVASLTVGARDAHLGIEWDGLAEHPVDCVALGVGGRVGREAEVHLATSTRTAVALNSAVPLFGSVALIVSTFVSA